MSANITMVSPDRNLVHREETVEELCFYPMGSPYMRHTPHFRITRHGFEQNLPLRVKFIIVHNGEILIKDTAGGDFETIVVVNQVWFIRKSMRKATVEYRHLSNPIRPTIKRRGKIQYV